MKVDLVLEGGGLYGLAFVGAFKALEEAGYQVERIAGTSAGSMIASLIHAGYTSKELLALVEQTDFNQFATKTRLSRFTPIGKAASLVFNKGIYSNEGLRRWLDRALTAKGSTTFNTDDRLKVIASDVTHHRLMVLPDCLPEYDRVEEDFSIAYAVQMSTCIPFYFIPIRLPQKECDCYIVDGGILSNFPVWIFDREGKPRWPTFGIKIKDKISNTLQNKTGFLNYTQDVIRTMIDKDETIFLKDSDRVRTVVIEVDETIDGLNFDLSRQDIDKLIEAGYRDTKKFLESFNFEQYCRRYRSHTTIE